jgi:hypothetical protein
MKTEKREKYNEEERFEKIKRTNTRLMENKGVNKGLVSVDSLKRTNERVMKRSK